MFHYFIVAIYQLYYFITALVHIALLMLHFSNVATIYCCRILIAYFINITLFYPGLLMLNYFNASVFDFTLFDAAVFTIALSNVLSLCYTV